MDTANPHRLVYCLDSGVLQDDLVIDDIYTVVKVLCQSKAPNPIGPFNIEHSKEIFNSWRTLSGQQLKAVCANWIFRTAPDTSISDHYRGHHFRMPKVKDFISFFYESKRSLLNGYVIFDALEEYYHSAQGSHHELDDITFDLESKDRDKVVISTHIIPTTLTNLVDSFLHSHEIKFLTYLYDILSDNADNLLYMACYESLTAIRNNKRSDWPTEQYD